MKTLNTVYVSLVVILVTGAFGTANGQVGFAAGLNFDRLGDVQTGSVKGTFEASTGYHIGVFFDLNVGPVAIRPGVYLRDVGEVAFRVNEVEQPYDLSMIEIPVDVRLPLIAAPVVKPYVFAGPVLSFPRSSDTEFEGLLESVAISASVGAGVQVTIPGVRVKLYPEVRYAFGLSRFLNDSFQLGTVTFEAEDQIRLNGVMVRLGIGI